jgi:hypothetical protein
VRRLVEEELQADSPEHRLAELVRATPRLADSPAKQQWTFSQVTARASGRSTASPPRRTWIWAFAAIAVLASVAAAATGLTLHERGSRKSVESAVPTPVAPPPAPSAAAEAVPVPVPAPAGVETPEAPTAPPPVAKAAIETPSTGPRVEERAGDKRRFGGGEDPTPVLEAIRALRAHGDAARASTLLSGYLKAHPNGVLAEDALALSIESAIAQHDTGRAADLGRRYLVQFPNGRYRAFATQATQP